MQCDMCGKETELFLAEIEGTQLKVCERCAKHGKVIKRVLVPRPTEKKETMILSQLQKEPEEEVIQVIVHDFAKKIKDAREKLGLKQEDLAKKINERLSLIHQFERSHLEPEEKVAKKLEHFLNIKLVEEHKEKHSPLSHSKSDSLTIGDTITIKKRKR